MSVRASLVWGLWVAAVILLIAALPVSAQSATWSQPVALSADGVTSWFPDVVADGSGQVHVVWASGVSVSSQQAFDTVMYSSSADGSKWSSPLDIVAIPTKGAVTRPTVASDSHGILHLTYRSYTIYYSHAPVQSVVAPALTPGVPISSADNGYFSRLAIDAKGSLHLVYTEHIQSADCPACLHVYYRASQDNGQSWSAPVDVSQVPTGAAKPQILVDSKQVLHVVWESGRGGDLGQLADPTAVMYTASDDGGKTWRPPTTLGPANSTARNIALGLTGSGQLVAAYLALPDDRVYFQTSSDEGVTWSQPQLIPNALGAWSVYQGKTDGYSMTTDGSGNVHLVYVGRTSDKQVSLSVLHLSWDGSAWSAPDPISTISGDVPEWPRAAVGLGNRLHVVWFVRDQQHIFGGEGVFRYRIWYAQRGVDATPAVPIVWPTLTPTAEVTLTTTAEAGGPGNVTSTSVGSTPLPAFPSDAAIPPAESENQAILTLSKGLAPVILLLAAITVGTYLRRR
jgi:hypothetical protein